MIGRILAWAAAATVAVVAVLCVVPIRWDLKALGFVLPRASDGAIPPGQSVLFVTSVGGAAETAVGVYGLDLVTFPEGATDWMWVGPPGMAGSHALRWALRADGGLEKWSPGKCVWQPSEWEPKALMAAREGEGLVLAADVAAKAHFRQRYPEVPAGKVVLMERRRASFAARPPLAIEPAMLVRLPLALAALGLLWAGVTSLLSCRGVDRVTAFCFAVPAVLAAYCGAAFLLGCVLPGAVPLVLAGVAVAGAGLLLLNPPAREPDSGRRTGSVALGLGGAVFAAACVFQLDLDGDLLTHWLSAARSLYYRGFHDLRFLLDRYGIGQEAAYPPAFPLVEALLMWISGMSRGESMLPGAATHAFVLLYRLLIVGVHLAFVMAWVWGGGASGKLRPWRLAGVVALLGLVPLFRGQPAAAEVFFVPMVGFAVLGVVRSIDAAPVGAAGDALRRLAIALGVFCLFIKNDAMLVLPAILLPAWWVAWARLAGRRPAACAGDVAVALLAAVPLLVWRAQIRDVGVPANLLFHPVSAALFRDRMGTLAPLAAHGLKWLLQSGSWLLLFAALPAAAWCRLARARGEAFWAEAAVPAGILGYVGATVIMYVFSASDPLNHMETSFSRLAASAVVAAAIHAVRSWDGDAAGEDVG